MPWRDHEKPERTGKKDKKKGPSKVTMVSNYVKSQANHAVAVAKGTGYTRSTQEIEQLLSICQNCPSELYEAETERCLHAACGCTLSKQRSIASNPLAMSTKKCPDGHHDTLVKQFERDRELLPIVQPEQIIDRQ